MVTIMKKTYITPQTLVVEVESDNALMQMSINRTTTIDEANAGLVKGESSAPSNYNVWDDDWSKQ